MSFCASCVGMKNIQIIKCTFGDLMSVFCLPDWGSFGDPPVEVDRRFGGMLYFSPSVRGHNLEWGTV